MEYHGVDNLVRKRVFFVNESFDKDGCGSGVVHFAEVEEGRGRVEDGDGNAREDGADDLGFFKGASSGLEGRC